MSNNQEPDSRDAAPVVQTVPQHPVAPPSDNRVSRGWLIAAVAAGGALLLTLAFGGGIATGLGISAITGGGLVAERNSGPGDGGPFPGGPGGAGPDERGPGRWGDGPGPLQSRPDDGARRDRQDGQDATPTPSPTPGA
jgi:hypothetical protein